MRFVVGVLAGLGLGAIPVAFADPAATSPAPSVTAPSAAPAASAATAPAAPPAPAANAPSGAKETAAASATAAIDPIEKHFVSEGYRVEMRHGEKMYCRREEVLGSRLGARKVCSTAQQLKASEDQAHEALERAQRQQVNPTSR